MKKSQEKLKKSSIGTQCRGSRSGYGGRPNDSSRLPQNMMNAMNKVLRDCILEITMSLFDDIPIKG
jgi:hypothetical protein